MSRKEIQVDVELLKKLIVKNEQGKVYTSHSALFADVADAYNLERGVLAPINPQLVGLRVKGLAIPILTAKGKKGRAKGFHPVGTKVPRAEKLASNPDTQAVLSGIRKEIKLAVKSEGGDPARFLKIVDKMEAGSITAAVKMKCLDCSNYQTEEIKHCQCGPGSGSPCALWLIRPYQNASQENE